MKRDDFTLDKPIGELLQDARYLKKIGQKEIAASANVSTNYISMIERGLHNPSFDVFYSYCKTLKMTPDEILGFSEKKDDQKIEALIDTVIDLKPYQKDCLITMAKDMKRANESNP